MENELKNNFKFIFNDRAFDDNWAEPYIVEIITQEPMKLKEIKQLIQEGIDKAENSEDGMIPSKDGIKQIFSYIKKQVIEIKISQCEYNFAFGDY